MPVRTYTLEILQSLRESEASLRWPSQLSADYKNEDGLWDPHRAFSMSNNAASTGGSSTANYQRSGGQHQHFSEGGASRENSKTSGNYPREHKSSTSGQFHGRHVNALSAPEYSHYGTSNPNQDAESIVLGPQKRNWIEGCHVTTSSASSNATVPPTKRNVEEPTQPPPIRGRGRGTYNASRGGGGNTPAASQSNSDNTPGSSNSTVSATSTTTSSRFANISLSTGSSNRGGGGGGYRAPGGNPYGNTRNTAHTGGGMFHKGNYGRSGGGGYTSSGHGYRPDHRMHGSSGSGGGNDDPEWFTNAPTNFGDTVDLEGIRDDDTKMLAYKRHAQSDSLSTKKNREAEEKKAASEKLFMELEGFPDDILEELSPTEGHMPELESPFHEQELHSPFNEGASLEGPLKQIFNTAASEQGKKGSFPVENPILKLQQQLQRDATGPHVSEEASQSAAASLAPGRGPRMMTVDDLERDMARMPTSHSDTKKTEVSSGPSPHATPGPNRELDAKLLGLILGGNKPSNSTPSHPVTTPSTPPSTPGIDNPNKEKVENLLRNLLLKSSSQEGIKPQSSGSAAVGAPPGNKVMTVEELEADMMRTSGTAGVALGLSVVSSSGMPPPGGPLLPTPQTKSSERHGSIGELASLNFMPPFLDKTVGGQAWPPVSLQSMGQGKPLMAMDDSGPQGFQGSGMPVGNLNVGGGAGGPLPTMPAGLPPALQQSYLLNLMRQQKPAAISPTNATSQLPQFGATSSVSWSGAGQSGLPSGSTGSLFPTGHEANITATSAFSGFPPNAGKEGLFANPAAHFQQQQQPSVKRVPFPTGLPPGGGVFSQPPPPLPAGLAPSNPMLPPSSSSSANGFDSLPDINSMEHFMRAIRKGPPSTGQMGGINGSGSVLQETSSAAAVGLLDANYPFNMEPSQLALQKQNADSGISQQYQNVRMGMKPGVVMPPGGLPLPSNLGRPLARYPPSSNLLQQISQNQFNKDGPGVAPAPPGARFRMPVGGVRPQMSAQQAMFQSAPITSATSRPIVKNMALGGSGMDPFLSGKPSDGGFHAAMFGGTQRDPGVSMMPGMGRGATDMGNLMNLGQPRSIFPQQQPHQQQAQGTGLPSMSHPPPGWPFREQQSQFGGPPATSSNFLGSMDPLAGRARTVNEIEAEVMAKNFAIGPPSKATLSVKRAEGE